MNYVGSFADILGIISAVLAAFSWFKARRHSQNATKALDIIKNYRKVETFTEVNKKLEQIKNKIRDVGTNRGSNVQKQYKEIEIVLGEIINSLPSKYNQLIQEAKKVEHVIRESSDKNQRLVGAEQYTVIDSIDIIKTGIKTIMEELLQEA